MVQLATNQMKQKIEANRSVSVVVKGGRCSSWRLNSTSSYQTRDEGQVLDMQMTSDIHR